MSTRTLGALLAGLLAMMPVGQAANGLDDANKVMSDFNRALSVAMRGNKRVLPEDQSMEFVGRLFDLADEAEDGAGAVEALSYVLTIANYMDGDNGGSVWCETIERLIDEHLDEDAMVGVVFALESAPAGMQEQRAAYLAEIAEDTHSNAVKGAVVFLDAQKLMRARDSGETFTAHQTKVLMNLLSRLQTEFKDVEDPYGRGTFGGIAEGMQFSIEKLSVGKQAPDIVAGDLDGVEFKLSDYRGKVVLLDFWGHW